MTRTEFIRQNRCVISRYAANDELAVIKFLGTFLQQPPWTGERTESIGTMPGRATGLCILTVQKPAGERLEASSEMLERMCEKSSRNEILKANVK